jgi:hypothetical protein
VGQGREVLGRQTRLTGGLHRYSKKSRSANLATHVCKGANNRHRTYRSPLPVVAATSSISLGEERFEGAVETQDREPAFLRIGLNPVARAHTVGLKYTVVEPSVLVSAADVGKL